MNPQLRQALVALAAMVLAAWTGLELADGNLFWPSLAAAVAVAAILARLLTLPFDVILTGMVLFGYLAGNRGFAQLMPAPGVPLLPAELALATALGWRTVVCALRRQSPFGRAPLDLAVLAWLAVGGARFLFDLPGHGLTAVRDFATVYYALFYFLTVHMARDPRARRYLLSCLVAGLAVLPFSFGLSLAFPQFFLTMLTIHGAPLVFFKGDLAYTFFAVGALLLFHHAAGPARPWALLLAAALLLALANSDSRSSAVGLAAASALLLAARRWRFPALQGALLGAALAGVVVLAFFGNNGWAQRKLHGAADRLRSIVDLSGQGTYASEESYFKGDNNRFRAVWWRNVIVETWQGNPVVGLGFGHDLAHHFVQEYYPDMALEDFNTRSPHNIFVTVFGRLGLVGLAAWCAVGVAMLRATWTALRRTEDRTAWALWCGSWIVLVSATFGVVLEGPMGAVPFWVMLGLAHTAPSAAPAPAPAEKTPASAGAGPTAELRAEPAAV